MKRLFFVLAFFMLAFVSAQSIPQGDIDIGHDTEISINEVTVTPGFFVTSEMSLDDHFLVEVETPANDVNFLTTITPYVITAEVLNLSSDNNVYTIYTNGEPYLLESEPEKFIFKNVLNATSGGLSRTDI